MRVVKTLVDGDRIINPHACRFNLFIKTALTHFPWGESACTLVVVVVNYNKYPNSFGTKKKKMCGLLYVVHQQPSEGRGTMKINIITFAQLC